MDSSSAVHNRRTRTKSDQALAREQELLAKSSSGSLTTNDPRPNTPKVVVTDVADGCAASGLLLKGDRLLAINGERVTDEVNGRALAKVEVGEVSFSIVRAGELTTVAVHKPESTTRLGVTIKNLTVELQTDQGAKVVVTDVADGCAASGLVVKGDKILSINGTPLTDEVQGRALAKEAVGEVAFSVQRGNGRLTVTVTKPEAATRLGVTLKNIVSKFTYFKDNSSDRASQAPSLPPSAASTPLPSRAQATARARDGSSDSPSSSDTTGWLSTAQKELDATDPAMPPKEATAVSPQKAVAVLGAEVEAVVAAQQWLAGQVATKTASGFDLAPISPSASGSEEQSEELTSSVSSEEAEAEAKMEAKTAAVKAEAEAAVEVAVKAEAEAKAVEAEAEAVKAEAVEAAVEAMERAAAAGAEAKAVEAEAEAVKAEAVEAVEAAVERAAEAKVEAEAKAEEERAPTPASDKGALGGVNVIVTDVVDSLKTTTTDVVDSLKNLVSKFPSFKDVATEFSAPTELTNGAATAGTAADGATADGGIKNVDGIKTPMATFLDTAAARNALAAAVQDKNANGAKVIVTDVANGCAASGLVIWRDKIISINGTPVTDEVQGTELAKAAVGNVTYAILRAGLRMTVTGTRHILL